MRDLLAAGRFAEAERDGRRRLAETPADDAATMLLGVAVLRQGRPAAAAALFRQAACLRGSDPQPLINQGVALREAGQGQAAEAAYHRALACAPDHPDACFNLANLHKERGDGAKALEFYDRACRLAPERAEFHYNRANLLAGCDRLEEAVAAFAAAGRQRGTTEILVNAGMALKRLGQVGAALDCFERAVAQAPDDVGAHWNRGLTRLLLGDLAGGWADYEWRWRLPDAPGCASASRCGPARLARLSQRLAAKPPARLARLSQRLAAKPPARLARLSQRQAATPARPCCCMASRARAIPSMAPAMCRWCGPASGRWCWPAPARCWR